MKKLRFLFILSIVSTICTSTIYAQDDKFFTFGLKAGANLTTMSGFGHNGYSDKTKPEIEFTAGFTADLAITRHWTILTALEYVPKGLSLDRYSSEYSTTIPYYKAKYLQLPIHVGYKIKSSDDSNVIFHIGPYFAYGIGGDIQWKDSNNKIGRKAKFFEKDQFNRFDCGLGIGVNVDTKNFAFNVGYDHGLIDITKSSFEFPDTSNIDAEGISVKTRCLYLTIGYKYRLGF